MQSAKSLFCCQYRAKKQAKAVNLMSYIYPESDSRGTRYKVYFLYQSKKIYLGLFPTFAAAESCLKEALDVTENNQDVYHYTYTYLDYKKFISLCNFRDHNVYIKNPIYINAGCFKYFLSEKMILMFDMKDLLFFSANKIYKRGNYIYTQDSITQQSILSRFGIPAHSILGIDYQFKNKNCCDFRRENLEIINHYKGVSYEKKNGRWVYAATIFINQNIVIGHYETQTEAAAAYNKAVDLLEKTDLAKDYIKNEFPFLTLAEYRQLYDKLTVSPCITQPSKLKRVVSSKKYRGTCKDKSGYRSSIGYKGSQIYLGIFPTEKRAAQAYNFASFYLYGNSGFINDISPLIDNNDSAQIARQLAKYHTKKKPTAPL